MSVRPRAPAEEEELKQGCCSRGCERLCEAVIAAVKRRRKRRERKRLREELDSENLVVKRNVVTSTIENAPLGQVTLASGELVDITSVLLFRPTLRERLFGRAFVFRLFLHSQGALEKAPRGGREGGARHARDRFGRDEGTSLGGREL